MKHETRPTPETDEHLNLYAHPQMAARLNWADFSRKLERERDEMREAIIEFCKEHDWACDEWKRQPHIAKLFKLSKKP